MSSHLPAVIPGEKRKTIRIYRENNFCGHNPERLDAKLFLRPLKKGGTDGLPKTIITAAERVIKYFDNPALLPSLNHANGSETQQRSERRESCIIVMLMILGRTDLTSLRVGMPTKNGFINFGFEWLRKETRLGEKRLQRAVKDLKAAGIITVTPVREKQPDGTWKGFSAVKCVSKHFFGALGLTNALEKEQKKAKIRLLKKIEGWNKDDGGRRTLTSISKFALVISMLKNGGKQPTSTAAKRKPKPPDPPPKKAAVDHVANMDATLARMMPEKYKS